MAPALDRRGSTPAAIWRFILGRTLVLFGHSWRSSAALLYALTPAGDLQASGAAGDAAQHYTSPALRQEDRPYDDLVTDAGLLYRYRGTDPRHPDNIGLRLALQRQRPLIYFHGIVPGQYFPDWPVYVVADSPVDLTFTVSVDDRRMAGLHPNEGVNLIAVGRVGSEPLRPPNEVVARGKGVALPPIAGSVGHHLVVETIVRIS